MKALLLTLTIMSISVSSFACSCQNPNFNEEDIKKVISQHLNVSDEISLTIEQIKRKTFLTKENKRDISPLRGSNWLYACAKSCTQIQNEKSTYAVSYENNGQICSGKIKVTMISNRDDDGFESSAKGKVSCR